MKPLLVRFTTALLAAVIVTNVFGFNSAQGLVISIIFGFVAAISVG